MSTGDEWYYLENAQQDESEKKGPLTLEQLIENAPADSMVTNGQLLQTNTPWISFSQVLNSIDDDDEEEDNDDTDEQDIDLVNGNGARKKITLLNNKHVANQKQGDNHNKANSIQIQLQIPNNHTVPDHPNDDVLNTKQSESTQQQSNSEHNDEQPSEAEQQRSAAEKQKMEELRQKQEEKLKQQVLSIQADEQFDEEWFVLDEKTKETVGPFTRWQLVKQVNEKQLHENTITYLNGSKQFRFLKMCGELTGLLPFIERDATIQSDNDVLREHKVLLTKDELENKQWCYKDAYQQQQGPVSLSEIFYKLEQGILGRNSEIKQENEVCWKTVEFIQKKFSLEWNQMVKQQQQNDKTDGEKNTGVAPPAELAVSDVESDVDEQEQELKYDPSFRALLELDKEVQIEKKLKHKYPEKYNGDTNGEQNTNDNTEGKNDGVSNNKRKRKRKRSGKQHKNEKQKNASIYVSGLPLDISVYEMDEFFKKAGVIATDIYSQGQKMITLFQTEGKQLSGDAVLTYHQPHSVQLAMDMLDETEIRNGYPVHIKRATDEHCKRYKKMCGPKKKKRKLDPKKEATLKQLYGVESQLSWDDDVSRTVPQLHWVVLQNLFNAQQMAQAASMEAFVEEIKQEIVSECAKIGPIEKIEVYESNPKGVVKLKYKFPQHAALCIEKMNRRYFDGNIVDCCYWNGVTDYTVHETAEQQEERLKQFQKAIQNEQDM